MRHHQLLVIAMCAWSYINEKSTIYFYFNLLLNFNQ